MNLIPKLKTLPLATVIALGLALSPTLSIAGDKDYDKGHGRSNKQFSHESSKPRIKQQRKEQVVTHGYDRHGIKGYGHDKVINNYYSRPHAEHSRHVYYRNDPYRHHHHDHEKYIIVDHDHHEHYVDMDDVRFKIGIHTGNFDIVFRD